MNQHQPFGGRFMSRGITWKSGVVAVVLVVVAVVGTMLLIKSQREPLGVEVTVTSSAIVGSGPSCELQLGLQIANSGDRGVLVLSAHIDNLENSSRGLMASIDPGEADVRTYALPLDPCPPSPQALGLGDVVVVFRLRGGSTEHSVTATMG